MKTSLKIEMEGSGEGRTITTSALTPCGTEFRLYESARDGISFGVADREGVKLYRHDAVPLTYLGFFQITCKQHQQLKGLLDWQL